jgi:hypothetical protein
MNPTFSIFDSNVEPVLKESDLNLDIYEVAVAVILAASIKVNLTPNSFLMTFDSRDIKTAFSKYQSFENMDVENLIGSIWQKTRNFLNINLEMLGKFEMLKEEKDYQILAVANMWSFIFKNYSTHTLEECKQLPFYTVFTNRQAQVLLKTCQNSGMI